MCFCACSKSRILKEVDLGKVQISSKNYILKFGLWKEINEKSDFESKDLQCVRFWILIFPKYQILKLVYFRKKRVLNKNLVSKSHNCGHLNPSKRLCMHFHAIWKIVSLSQICSDELSVCKELQLDSGKKASPSIKQCLDGA